MSFSTLRRIGYGSFVGLAGLLPFNLDDTDKVDKRIKTAGDFANRQIVPESGPERIKRMFELDEFGTMTTELNSIMQAGFLGLFFGVCYGGVTRARDNYNQFMDSNQATAFRSHLDAKKQLQDKVTIGFAKGAFRWGWRISLFTTCYVGVITVMSVYRGKSSIWEYIAAGSSTGALFRMNMGLRGMAAGAVVGGGLGIFAGGMSMGVMKLSGTSMEEVRYWQYKWHKSRIDLEQAGYAKQAQSDNPNPLLDAHHELVGEKKLTLEDIKDDEEEKKDETKETAAVKSTEALKQSNVESK